MATTVTLKPNAIDISGSTSGTTTLQATAVAGTTTITLPATTGTVITTGDTGTVTNTMLAGSIANAKLSNSSVTVGSTSIALGATSTTLAGLTGVTSSVITDSGLTSGRVTYASTGGLLADSANLTFNGTTLTTANDASINSATIGSGGGNFANNFVAGNGSLGSNTTGTDNSAFGYNALSANTTGQDNSSVGFRSLYTNTTGAYNTAIGSQALRLNTTASNNTAVGYQAGYSNTTGAELTAIGYKAAYSQTTAVNSSNVAVGNYALYTNTTGTNNTSIGWNSLANATGTGNTGVGYSAGESITSGSKNTIIGRYSGNQGGLDIRTASNYIVLSDGDGNPRMFNDGTNWTNTGNSFSTTPSTQTNAASFISNSTGGSFFFSIDNSAGGTFGQGAYQRNIYSTGTTYRIYVTAGNNGVYLAPSGTSWTSNSDERLKENLVPIENGLAKVASLRAVTGNYIADEDKKSRAFLIAQDLQAVLPEAVDATEPEKLGVSYTDVIPLLVASIKELKTIVDAQAAEIAELKAKVGI